MPENNQKKFAWRNDAGAWVLEEHVRELERRRVGAVYAGRDALGKREWKWLAWPVQETQGRIHAVTGVARSLGAAKVAVSTVIRVFGAP